ncbi:MAG: hypothetical protein AAGA76_06360 [Pseudomonadota bacterium]
MNNKSIALSLLVIRVTVFILMIVWAALKIIRPEAYVGIYAGFYGTTVGISAVYIIGGLQILFLFAYLAGMFKTITYGGVLLMNAVTLLVSIPKMLPLAGQEPNLLFYASFPVFGASLAHYLMREHDTMFALGKQQVPSTAS